MNGYFDGNVTHIVTEEKIATGEIIHKSLCSDSIHAESRLSDIPFVEISDQIFNGLCPHCLDANFEIDLHNPELSVSLDASSLPSDFMSSLHDGTAARLSVFESKFAKVKEIWKDLRNKIMSDERIDRKEIIAMEEAIGG